MDTNSGNSLYDNGRSLNPRPRTLCVYIYIKTLEFSEATRCHDLRFHNSLASDWDFEECLGRKPQDEKDIREFSFVPLGFVPLGFGSLNHGIWPSIRVFGTQNLGVQTLRVQT